MNSSGKSMNESNESNVLMNHSYMINSTDKDYSLKSIVIQMSVNPEYLTKKQIGFIEENFGLIKDSIDRLIQEIRNEVLKIPVDHRVAYFDYVQSMIGDPFDHDSNSIRDIPKNRAIIIAWNYYVRQIRCEYL